MKETIHSLLAGSLPLHSAAEAIVAPARPALTYDALADQLARDHAVFRDAGLGPRSRIGVAMPSSPEGLVAILAASASAACAPVDPELEAGALERLMAAMRIEALIVAEGSTSNAVRAAQAVGVPLLLLSTSAGGPAGAHALKAAVRRDGAPDGWPAPDDLAFLWHTSGTTGAPKIVPYEQWRLCADVRQRVARRGIGATDRCLVTTPLTSSVTVRTGLLPNLATGAAVIHAGNLAAESVLAVIESLAPTYFMAAPALYRRLLELIEGRGAALRHRLRVLYSSFAEQSPQVRERLEQMLGVPMVQTYGMTETGGIAETAPPPDAAPRGSIGRPITDVAIAGDDGSFLGRGQEGEIWVRGPGVITAYESPPEANAGSFRGGWFRTGDCGYLDEQGFLHLTGRIKDTINRGGVKVSPVEVELALANHPAVKEAAVFARRHATLGEDVCALVVFEDGRTASEAELRRFARQRLSAAKVPTRIVAAAALPRNAAGKLPRAEVAAFGESLLRQSWQPPEGPQEEQVAAIFRQVLRVDDISRSDRFFDRGGDSLRAVEVIERVRESFGVSLAMDTLLDNPSVTALTKVITESAGRTCKQPS